MPSNSTRYAVNVLLDPESFPGTNQSVIFNATDKKFELGTGTGVTINNHADNRITTATSDANTLNAESYFRYVATGEGTGVGKVIIGATSGQYATLYHPLHVTQPTGTNAQIIAHSLDGDDPYVRFGLQDTNVSVIGFGAKSNASNRKFQIGTYPGEDSFTFTSYWSMNHAGRVGMGEGTSPVLGKSYTDSNWQLFVTRDTDNSVDNTNISTAAIQNSTTTSTNQVKVLQLFQGVRNTNLTVGGNYNAYGASSNPRWIEFYCRNSSNTNDYLMGYFAGGRSGGGTFTVEKVNASDKRLKTDIKPLTEGLDTLLKIQPVSWKWKHNPFSGKGFIAQDLYEIYPEAVYKPLIDDNEDPEQNPWGVSQEVLIPLLVKSIQDQQKIIEELKIKVNILENKL